MFIEYMCKFGFTHDYAQITHGIEYFCLHGFALLTRSNTFFIQVVKHLL